MSFSILRQQLYYSYPLKKVSSFLQIPEPPHYYNTQPVIVFLHAGTWLAGGGGEGLFQPDYMIESDVMVVTINHRLGPFGKTFSDELCSRSEDE